MPNNNRSSGRRPQSPGSSSSSVDDAVTPLWRKLRRFLFLLFLDAVATVVLLFPVLPEVVRLESLTEDHYTLHGTLWDLGGLAVFRIVAALWALLVSYHQEQAPPESPFNLFHKNGVRKSKAELEEESLEEPVGPKLKRYIFRKAFVCEIAILAAEVLVAIKCLSRLNVEIGLYDDARPQHVLFWIALAVTGFCCLIESSYIDSMEIMAGRCGRARRQELRDSEDLSVSWMEQLSHSLAQPLLPSANTSVASSSPEDDEEMGSRRDRDDEDAPGYSDIGADANYKAKWSDLLIFCEPDKYLLMLAILFLMGAAVANVLVPRYTGDVLDSLVRGTEDQPAELGQLRMPKGFISNVEKLVLASVLGGVFSGIRGAIFTIVGARVNARLRIRLMDSLLSQDIGFYDTTRTGNITSRLSSDTSIAGNSITSNVDTFLRSVVRAAGTLVFMVLISWQLSLLAFITIPAVAFLSRWYGRFIRKLFKLQQKKLAEGNAVSESALSSMPTVRTFGAEKIEMTEFESCIQNFLSLNKRAAVATLGYQTCLGVLPQLVTALVLFYGGLLVQTSGPHSITGGQLVTFILYVSALSESFNSLGGIFASLTRALGAADKVFELMHREPRLSKPSFVDPARLAALESGSDHLLGIDTNKVAEQRARGLYPDSCRGEIVFKNVQMSYPARPQRVVLRGMDLEIKPGSVVALVGESGSGKSSVVSLIQHLYEPSNGDVLIDGVKVQELCPDWLSRQVAVVSQEPTLFARSVRRNIIYGLEGSEDEPSMEEVEEAARLANASSFIEKLPFGYETDVGERGIQLSGGQKQRVAIARALVRKPRILLLDEATSALDSTSEHMVQSAIDDMVSGQRSLDGDPARSMTVVIVAHRLSTVRNADVIFVVQDGKVVEQGNHDELIEKEDGAYSTLVRRQMSQIT